MTVNKENRTKINEVKNEILRKIYDAIFDIERTIKYNKELREEIGVPSAVDYKRREKPKNKIG